MKKPKPPAPMRQLTDIWCNAFQAFHGDRYLFCGAKDGSAAAKLVASGIPIEEIIAVARKAWANRDGFWSKHAITLAQFASRFNEIRQENKGGSRPASLMDLKTILQAKESLAEQMRNKYSSQTAITTVWEDDSKRREWVVLRREIEQLKQRISGFF